MRFVATFRVLGILLMLFSLSMLPPMMIAKYYHEMAAIPVFLTSFFMSLGTGFVLWLACCRQGAELKQRDGFLVVVLFWTVLSAYGAIPLMLDPGHHMRFIDAAFETVSGLTTTGATVISHVHQLPLSVLYYREQLHFLGGMGIIVLAVAILPMLGVGGMQMARAESSGPMKNTKLKPRMAETAKALWGIYVGLVLLCAIFYWLAGMDFLEALMGGFTTISTGGLSMFDASFAHYNSLSIDIIAIVFMVAGAINFGVHFRFVQTQRLMSYFKDPEFRAYMYWLLFGVVVTFITIEFYDHFKSFGKNMLHSVFSVVSMSTTSGLTITNIADLPSFLPYFLILFSLVGGCAASTTGGIKIIRIILLRVLAIRELKRLVHPQAVLAAKLGKHSLPEEVMLSIWGFMTAFIALYTVLVLLLLIDHNSLVTSFSAAAACLSNAGVGLGAVAGNFAHISAFSKSVLIVAMLAGRLEIFTLLVLLSPDFWKK